MPKTHVDKSIVIQKSVAEVFEKISDFHHWTIWSPWLVLDPDAKVNVREDGKYYEWEGDLVGAGNMTILSSKAPEHIHVDLMFLKPWKSKAKVDLYFKEVEGGTQVNWTMDSSLPFFMFWMKKIMEAFIGMDFDRGLRMMKDYLENGKVHSELEFIGIQDYKGGQYVGITSDCQMDEMEGSMKENYEKLMSYFMDGRQEVMDGNPFSIYHKWEPVKGRVRYTAAIPVRSVPDDLPTGVATGKVAATRVHVIRNTGPYDHIGNMWSAQMSRLRSKKFRTNKAIHPMEVYFNSPKNTDPKDLVTEVWMSVK